MALSLEEFRSSLLNADARQGLGIHLSDSEAQQVYADPQASQSWFDYWLTISQPPAPMPLGGHDLAQHSAFASAPPAYRGAPASFATTIASATEAPAKKSRVALWVTLSVIGALLLMAAIVIITAFSTARHWTKTDVPERPETFHSEEYETGRYLVSDDTVSPCAVDQDWTDCIAAMEAQYAAGCADVELVPASTSLCGQYRAEIDRMRAVDTGNFVVSSLGSFGQLTRTPEISTRQVSNDDYEPAVTHDAVCYLGFLGECK